jgi:predicted MPP superfamily phosphohydrolase
LAREPFDLVFLTGDLLDTPPGLEGCMELAGILRGRLGSFAVLGGHDYFLRVVHEQGAFFMRAPTPCPPAKGSIPNPVAELVEGLQARGVRVLHDESCTVTCGGRHLAIVGLEDAFLFQPDYAAAWRQVPEGVPTIVLAHSPDVLPEIVRRGADLAFFGHTHGGQVRLPMVGALVTRSHLEGRRASGLFREGNTVFSLNNGLGTDRTAPVRLLCRPDVTVMRIGD